MKTSTSVLSAKTKTCL